MVLRFSIKTLYLLQALPPPKKTGCNSTLFYRGGDGSTFKARFSNIFTVSTSLFREIDCPPHVFPIYFGFLIAVAIVLGQTWDICIIRVDCSLLTNLLHKFWFSNILHAGFILYINGNAAFSAVGIQCWKFWFNSRLSAEFVCNINGSFKCCWKMSLEDFFSFSFHSVFKKTFFKSCSTSKWHSKEMEL